MPQVAVDDGATRLYVDDSGGDGRPVVLIHGWPLSAQSWGAQLEPLRAAGCRVVSYDRRGFGRSDKPDRGYDYDTLADDLDRVLPDLELTDVTLVGFSMGGGEVARYVGRRGEDRLRSVVFAAAVPPYLLKTDDNPDGPLTQDAAQRTEQALRDDREAYFDGFITDFFSVDGEPKVGEQQRQEALAQCHQSGDRAALECMRALRTTDFRGDLAAVSVPTLVLHGDGDAAVPIEGSGHRTHEAVPHSQLVVLEGAPHGCNVSHAEQFNRAIIQFLET